MEGAPTQEEATVSAPSPGAVEIAQLSNRRGVILVGVLGLAGVVISGLIMGAVLVTNHYMRYQNQRAISESVQAEDSINQRETLFVEGRRQLRSALLEPTVPHELPTERWVTAIRDVPSGGAPRLEAKLVAQAIDFVTLADEVRTFREVAPRDWRTQQALKARAHTRWFAVARALSGLRDRSVADERSRMARISERMAHGWRPILAFWIVASLSLLMITGVVVRKIRRLGVRVLRAQEAIEVALTEAEAASQSKSSFLANMSHEIRTPMNGIMGMTTLLLGSGLRGEQQTFAETIHHSTEALRLLLNDILDFSKVEAGQTVLEPTGFDLRTTLEEVVALFTIQAGEEQLDLFLNYPMNAPRGFVGDRGRLRQIMLNLVGNAIKFTERGSVVISVEVGQRLKISVTDTGIGIALEAQARIFNDFAQADASTTRRYGGTGLGLAISRRLTELMGGVLSIKSELGRGSTFTVTIELPVLNEQPQEAALGGSWADSKGVGVPVLVVSRPPAEQILVAWLWEWGLLPQAEGSVDAAITQLGKTSFDLVVYDQPWRCADDDANLARLREAAGAAQVLVLSSGRQDDETWAMHKPVQRVALRARLEEIGGVSNHVTQPPLPKQVQKDPTGPMVLVVEDNKVNRMVAQHLIERLGCQVQLAVDGVEALEMCAARSFAAVFMDCQMPRMDGYEATRRLRTIEAESGAPRTPIIAMTANVMLPDQARCRLAGMDDFVGKPIKVDHLTSVLSRWTTQGVEAQTATTNDG